MYINYHVDENNFNADFREIYRFFGGGYTANVVVNKMVQKNIDTPMYPCKPNSIEQNYRQIECKSRCNKNLETTISLTCNCTYISNIQSEI